MPRLTINEHTLIGSAGIDEGNANGHYILWPKNPYDTAHELWRYFRARFKINSLGVVVVDSHCVPLRWGRVGISIGFFGIEPVDDHSGKPDIFSRPFKYARSNMIEGIAAAAVLAIGETNEQTPVCIVRDVPNLLFSDQDRRDELIITPEEDMYYPLPKPLLDSQ